MEGEVVRRRMSMIAAHFAASGDDTSPAHLLPMNCSGSLSSAIRRCDGRMLFARQGSDSQAFFMKQQVLNDQQGCSSRKCSAAASQGSCNASGPPMFSRPKRVERPYFSRFERIQRPQKPCESPTFDSPNFARPNSRNENYTAKSNGYDWSPRMDVVESGCSYIMTVEIPGVGASDIRVEVNDHNLVVMGKRFSQCQSVGGFSNSSISAYHRREISQGTYKIVWPLPSGVNTDRVSAELLDGILQITIPKI